MKRIILLILCLTVGFIISIWLVNKKFIVKQEPLPSVFQQLERHFKNTGLQVSMKLSVNTFPVAAKSKVEVHLTDIADKVFYIVLCNSPADAKDYLDFLENSASKSLHAMNDNLIVYMNDWGLEEPLSQAVLNSFAVFKVDSYQ